MRFILFIIGTLTSLAFASCRDIRIIEHKEWSKLFEEHQVQGALEYVDNNKERVHYYNKEFNATQITPGTSFQIFQALVALESAVAPTEAYTLPWNGNYYSFKHGKIATITDTLTPGFQNQWPLANTLSEAFKHNNLPFFQQLTSKITTAEMKHFIDTLKYGNRKYEGDTINFWNNGSLRISADEHVGILKRLYHSELKGFTERSQRIVRGLFDKTTKEDYTLNSKKFVINHNDTVVVQYMGYIEKIKKLKNPKTQQIDAIPHPYFFVLSVYDTDTTKDLEGIAQQIFEKILKETELKETFDNF